MSDGPLLDVRVECAGSIPELRALDGDHVAETSIADSVDTVMRTLGIPGHARCRVIARDEPDGQVSLRITCDGRPIGCPGELLRYATSYVAQRHLPAPSSVVDDAVWFRQMLERDALGADVRSGVVAVVAMTCASAVKRAPERLIGDAQFDAYAARLRDAEPRVVGEVARAVVAGTLEAGLSIADHSTVATVLQEMSQASSPEILEELLVRLRPATLDVCVAPEYLEELTTSASDLEQELFPFLRDGLFEEVGTTYPDFRFVADAALVGRSFQFRINHLTTPPMLGLTADEILVNDTPPRLAASGIDAEDATIPATSYPGAIVALAGSSALAERPELTTWKSMDHLILCFAAALREHGSRLVDRTFVQSSLERLRYGFPDLVEAVNELVPVDALVRLVRTLTRDRVPMKNLRLMLNELVGGIVSGIDGRDDDAILRLARSALADAITKSVATSTGTVVAYILDPAIEPAVLDPDHEGNREDVLAAWRDQLATLPQTAMRPALLVGDEYRARLAEILTTEFGFVRVLGYRDLSPAANVQPVDRLSAPS